VPCPHCGYADSGKRLSPSARTGRPRAYADDRCLGPDASRVGGDRVCQNTQVRTDRLELAVWQDVCALLAHPRRLAEEYPRRAHPNGPTTRTLLTTLEAQLGKLRQGLARLIDSDAEALIEKHEFEPRITRLRQRIAHVEAQRQQLAEEDALHTDLRLLIGRLEDFAAQAQEGLVEADWRRKREMIRALVTRVEVAYDQVNVVFRIEPRPGDPSPEKKSLQDCRGSNGTPVRRPRFGGMPVPPIPHSGFQPRFELPAHHGLGGELAYQGGVVDAIEAFGHIRLQDPCRFLVELDRDRADRIPGPTSRAKAIASGCEPGFPFRLQRLCDHALLGPIRDGGDLHSTLPHYPNHLRNR
jgi:site-specific DNA recombinase